MGPIPEEAAMTTVRLVDIQKALETEDRAELEELALGYVRSHALICALLGQEPPDHVSDHEVQERVRAMSTEDLAALLAPLALSGRVGYEVP
jgi:hypothetical protein